MPPGATLPAPQYRHKTQAPLRCLLCYDAALMLVIHTCGRHTIDGGSWIIHCRTFFHWDDSTVSKRFNENVYIWITGESHLLYAI